jgi:hypothetical protein
MAPADVAIGLCGRCPVAGACLAWALSVGDCHGVWGGTTARERRAMLVAWRTPEQAEELPYSEQHLPADLIVSAGELVPTRRRPAPRLEGIREATAELPLLKRDRARMPAC